MQVAYHSIYPPPPGVPPRTVPYEGDNFANSKMDNFSLIFKTS